MVNANPMMTDTDPDTREVRLELSADAHAFISWYRLKKRVSLEEAFVLALKALSEAKSFQKEHPGAPKLL